MAAGSRPRLRYERLARAAVGHGRLVTHRLDLLALGLLAEVVVRLAEKRLLSVSRQPSAGAVSSDHPSPADPVVR